MLLSIALVILSSFYIYTLSYPLPNSPPIVVIVGSLELDNIVLLHRGGDNLGFDTKLVMSIGNMTDYTTVGDYLDSESKNNGVWNIGEKVVYPAGDTTGINAGVLLVDSGSESVLMSGYVKTTFSDTYVYNFSIGKEYNMVRILGTFNVIVVYIDQDNDGFVLTLKLDRDGDILTILDSFEFDPNFCQDPNIIHVTGNIYAICYRGQGSDGTLKTVKISSFGGINDTICDTLVFDSDDCFEPDIIHVSGSIYAIPYRGDDDGFLKTIEILSDGDITAVQDTLEFDTNRATAPNIKQISGDIYAIVYCGKDDDGFLCTIEIGSNGEIPDSVNDTFEFDQLVGKDPVIAHVSGDIYAIAYEGENSDGFLKTVEISENGDINNIVIDSTEFDSIKGEEPDIIHVSGSIYAIAYSAQGDKGIVKTVEISNNGSIINPMVDLFEFSAICRNPNIIHVSNTLFGVAYRGSGNEGYFTTVHIKNNGEFL